MFAPSINTAAVKFSTLCGGFFLPRWQKEAKSTTNPQNQLKMIKSTDVPHNLREFNKVFNELLNYGRYEPSTVFYDLIDFGINYFLVDPSADERQIEILKKYPVGHQPDFHKALLAAIDTMKTEVFADGHKWAWFDVFGEFYMVIASSSKKSGLGQFFTPKPVCDMMAAMIIGNDPISNTPAIIEGEKYMTVYDPAAGSGRTLLAANQVTDGKICAIAQDLDPLCSKMAALNFALHGVRAEVICGDSLRFGDYRFGYQVNVALKAFGRPNIFIRTKEQTYLFGKPTIAQPEPESESPKLVLYM
jgi:type I restriction enzyme M protein